MTNSKIQMQNESRSFTKGLDESSAEAEDIRSFCAFHSFRAFRTFCSLMLFSRTR